MNKRVCFIGHRVVLDNTVREKLLQVVEELMENGCKIFTMGTHGEFDAMALSVCRELQQVYKDIEVQLVLTSLTILKNPNNYNDCLELYKDIKTITYNIELEYFKKRIIVSNRQMIDSNDILVCYVDSNVYHSGAKSIMKYAIKKGLKVINIYKNT